MSEAEAGDVTATDEFVAHGPLATPWTGYAVATDERTAYVVVQDERISSILIGEG